MDKIYQQHVDQTLDSVTEGRDIIAYRAEARAFLADLMEVTPREAWPTVLPVGRRLLAFADWRETMTPQSVMNFCLPRHAAMAALAPLRTDDYDPEAEHLTGLVECFRDAIGKPSLLVHRPDLGPSKESHIDYATITREVSG